MDDVEQLLREALSDRADRGAPDAAPLLPRFRVLHRRRRRQRFAAGASGAAVLVAAAVMGPQILGAEAPGRIVDDVRPAASSTQVPPTVSGRLGLQPGPLTIAPFPFVPKKILFGIRTPETVVEAGQPALVYQMADATVTVTASDSEPDDPQRGGKPLSKDGRTYTYTTGEASDGVVEDGQWRLRWRDASGPWVTITGSAPLKDSLNAVLDYAGALVPGQTPIKAPFTFGVVPGELVLDNVFSSGVVFRPADVQASTDFVGKVLISLDSELADGEVATDVPTITRGEDGAMLRLPRGDGSVLVLQVAKRISATDEELRQLAEGLKVTDTATLSQG